VGSTLAMVENVRRKNVASAKSSVDQYRFAVKMVGMTAERRRLQSRPALFTRRPNDSRAESSSRNSTAEEIAQVRSGKEPTRQASRS